MPTLTFSRFENRILTRIPCPTQRVLNCSSRCSPPLELRSRSIASRLARSRVRRRTRPIVARLAFWFDDDRSIDFFFCCVCWCVVVVWRSERFLFLLEWRRRRRRKKNQNTKNDEKQTKKREREAKKNFRNCTNFIILTNVNTSHLQTRRTHSIYYSRNSNIFFLLDYSCLQIFPHRETTSVSNAIYRVMCA